MNKKIFKIPPKCLHPKWKLSILLTVLFLVPFGWSNVEQGEKSLEDSLFSFSLTTRVCFHVGDFYITNRTLKKYDSVVELNPLLRPIVRNEWLFITVKFGLVAIGHYCLKGLYKKNKKLAWIVSVVSNIIVGYAVIRNLRLKKEG